MTRLSLFKELKNPVHGDKNKSDDVSWPFYGAIDEVLGCSHRNNENDDNNDNDNDNDNDDDLNPHEFLCISVTPEDPSSPEEKKHLDTDIDHETLSSVRGIKRIRNFNQDFSIEIERLPKIPIRKTRTLTRPSRIRQELRFRDNASEVLVSRLPPATELSIKTIKSSPLSSSSSAVSSLPAGLRVRKFSNNKEERDDSPRQFLRDALAINNKVLINGNRHTVCNYNNEIEEEEIEEEEDEDEEELEEEGEENEEDNDNNQEKERPRKQLKRLESVPPELRVNKCMNECNKLEERLNKFIEYTKRRDEENFIIMTRILNAVEKIADKK